MPSAKKISGHWASLANQLAIAIENARLLTEARASATQVQDVFNNFIRTEWSRAAQKAEQAGFRYNAGRIELLESPLENSDIASAVDSGALISRVANGAHSPHATATIPVKLRGEIIGVLHVEAGDPSRTWKDDELHADDLAATGLLQFGSRVSYRLLLAGGAADIAAFRDWLTPRLARGERLEDARNARPEIRNALDRAERFLGLAALLSVVLATVAVAMASRRYLQAISMPVR